MKSKEEIEQLAFLEYPRLINDPYNPMVDDNADERKIWINAYSQCQEDMQKDVEYWQGEYDHWHQQAIDMADKYNKLLEYTVKKLEQLADQTHQVITAAMNLPDEESKQH
jgi:hypothetical protein